MPLLGLVELLRHQPFCDEVTLEKHVCVTDILDGALSIIGTGNTLVGSLTNRPFGHGSMKLAHDVSYFLQVIWLHGLINLLCFIALH